MGSIKNQHQNTPDRRDVIAGIITAIILLVVTIWLVILLF